MKNSAPALVTLAVLSLPVVAHAAEGNIFLRQRNVLVGERVPKGYETAGIRLGAFTLSPAVEAGLSYNDNIFYNNARKVSDNIVSLAPSAILSSGWSRHALMASFRSEYQDFTKHSSENTFVWTLAGAGRLDYGAYNNLNFSVDYGQNYQPRYDPVAPQSVKKPIKFDAFNAQVGTDYIINRLKLTGLVHYSKFEYADALSLAGVVLPQNQRDYNRVSYTGRAEYAFSPNTSAYLLYSGNRQAYDLNGPDRNSHGHNVAIGASFDLPDLVTGEVQLGYVKQLYTSSRFKPSQGSEFNAKVSYFLTPLTMIVVQTGRDLRESPDPVASGVFTTSSSVEIDHELLRTLVLTANYTRIDDRYNGVDRRYKRDQFLLGAKYLVSPNIYLKATLQSNKLRSSGVNTNEPYDDQMVKVAITFKD